MPRRTKAEALATRDAILDAAEHVFAAKGVSRTSLEHIAAAGGVTRGAIYWHFKDKAELFNAMMDRAILPLDEAATRAPRKRAAAADPLAELHGWAMNAFHLIATDARTRRVFEIATHKVEYVPEMGAARERHLRRYRQWLQRAQVKLKVAKAQGLLGPRPSARVAAHGLWALTDGLIQFWLLDPSAFDLRRTGAQLVGAYLDALRVPGAR